MVLSGQVVSSKWRSYKSQLLDAPLQIRIEELVFVNQDGPMARVKKRFRERVASLEHPLLESMISGQRSLLAPTVQKTYQDTGTFHVLVVSGLHVGIIFLSIFFFLKLTLLFVPFTTTSGRTHDLTRVGSLALTALYCLCIPASVPCHRAMIMLSTYTLLRIVGKDSDVLSCCTLTTLYYLALSPSSLLIDRSFQLSFSAIVTLGILTRAYKTMAPIETSAWLMQSTFPAISTFSASLPAASIPANIVAIPFVSFATVPMTMIAVVLPQSELQQIFRDGAVASADGLTFILSFFVEYQVPFRDPKVISFVAVLSAFVLITFPLVARKFRVGLLTIAIMASPLGATTATVPESLELYFIDVGHGDSTLLRFPTGENWLIDVGGLGFNSVGLPKEFPAQRSVVPTLLRLGIRKVDLLLASHADADHINGFPALSNSGIEVAAVCATESVRRIFRKRGWMVQFAELPSRVGRYTIRRIIPDVVSSTWSSNNQSMVIDICNDNQCALFTGDIESEVERLLSLKRYAIVKVPHHGSSTSSTRRMVNSTSPQVAIISNGARNRFSLPSPIVVQRWRESGARVLETGKLGTILIKLEKDISIVTY